MAENSRQRGHAAYAKRDYEGAVRHYSDAIAIDANNHILYSSRCKAYAALQQWTEALADARKTEELNPRWATSHLQIGTANLGLHNVREGLGAFKQGIAIDHTDQILQSCYEKTKALAEMMIEPLKPHPFDDTFTASDTSVKLKSDSTTGVFAQEDDFVEMMHDVKKNFFSINKHSKDPRLLPALGVLLNVNFRAAMPDKSEARSKQSKEKQGKAESSHQTQETETEKDKSATEEKEPAKEEIPTKEEETPSTEVKEAPVTEDEGEPLTEEKGKEIGEVQDGKSPVTEELPATADEGAPLTKEKGREIGEVQDEKSPEPEELPAAEESDAPATEDVEAQETEEKRAEIEKDEDDVQETAMEHYVGAIGLDDEDDKVILRLGLMESVQYARGDLIPDEMGKEAASASGSRAGELIGEETALAISAYEAALKSLKISLSENRYPDILLGLHETSRLAKELEEMLSADPMILDNDAQTEADSMEWICVQILLHHFTQKLKDESSNTEAYCARAVCHMKLGELPKALSDAERCIELDPKSAIGYRRRGNVLFRMEEYDRAAEIYTHGLRSNPKDPDFFDGMIKCMRKNNEAQPVEESKEENQDEIVPEPDPVGQQSAASSSLPVEQGESSGDSEIREEADHNERTHCFSCLEMLPSILTRNRK